jgi:hypothetical protein
MCKSLALICAMTGLMGAGRAQSPCLTAPQAGKELLHFSRNISGKMIPGKSSLNPNATTTVIMLNCQPTPGAAVVVKSRQVNYGQLTIDFSVMTSCDELPTLKGTLVGDYFSLTRLSDPFSPATAADDTRIGRHNASGKVIDVTGGIIGSFSMVGTIGSVTQRPASIFGVGPCYWCQHHEGLITIKLNQSPLFTAGATITATYAWDVNADSADCKADPCLVQQYINQGTMDGLAEAQCGTVNL